ncbi:GNAT family N-acetyltransferase [bacterium]|nr:GNAT family N-acetyltransferase [bacterium]
MSKPSLITRRARREDFPRLVELWRGMIDEHFAIDARFEPSAGGNEAYLKYLHETLGQMDTQILVAESSGRVVGYTIATVFANPPVFALPQYGYIGELAVEEASRGAGVGRALWEAARAWLTRRGITVVQLNVSPLNQSGQKFWRSLGFSDFLHVLWYDMPGS